MAKQNPKPHFPSVHSANDEGLVCLGGELTLEWLSAAYGKGIFPWPWVDERGREVLAWYSPDPRAILEFDDFHVSRRLLRRIRSGQFRVTVDAAYEDVVRACSRRGEGEVWMTDALMTGYGELHRHGHSHSVEAWRDGALVGGVFGVTFGAYFSAESMFSRVTDGSKCALAYLVEHLRVGGFSLLDAQVATEHTCSLGVTEVPRREFLSRLRQALRREAQFSPQADGSLLQRLATTG